MVIGCGVFVGDNENIPNFNMMMNAQVYKYTKSHSILYFKWVNCTLCELYLIKLLTDNKVTSNGKKRKMVMHICSTLTISFWKPIIQKHT